MYGNGAPIGLMRNITRIPRWRTRRALKQETTTHLGAALLPFKIMNAGLQPVERPNKTSHRKIQAKDLHSLAI